MSTTYLLLLTVAGVLTGAVGAIAGIGGGILLIPVLVLLFHVPIHQAVFTSLAAVVATSTAAGSVYVGEGMTNMRLAMSLETATTLGGLSGGLLASVVSPAALSGLFGVVAIITAVTMLRGGGSHPPLAGEAATGRPTGHEEVGRLAGSYFDIAQGREVPYEATRLPLGLGVSLLAGGISGLLGVGGGFIKVPAMSLGMRVPLKVAAATSNFMIGVTAASGLLVYLQRSALYPLLVAPIVLGITAGALLGTRVAPRMANKAIARILAGVLLLAAVQMLLRASGVWHAR
ncbi:MAG: sulfite exporter TauE/SafE family protein [Candidatus Xenobia bacterium]